MCQQFDPLALMCRLTSTLRPLTRLDVLSHRVFFNVATAPAVAQAVMLYMGPISLALMRVL